MERGGTGWTKCEWREEEGGGAKGEVREGERVGQMRLGEGRIERGGRGEANGERGTGRGERREEIWEGRMGRGGKGGIDWTHSAIIRKRLNNVHNGQFGHLYLYS
jgi:hypothetical protein